MNNVHTAKIAVLILNWNGIKDTLECLKAVQAATYPHLDIILLDNGSSDDSVKKIRTHFPHAYLIESPKNLGFAEGNNVMIRAALKRGADFLFLLNNDTQISPNIFEHFLATFEHYPKAGIIGAKLLLFDQPKTMDHLGGLWNAKKGHFTLVGYREPADLPQWQEVRPLDYVCGAAILIRREVIETVGMFDPRYFLIWEEADLCMRAKKCGYEILTCPSATVAHKVSASFSGGKPHSTYFWWRNRLLWIHTHCPFKQRLFLYGTHLLPSMLHTLKLYWIKTMYHFWLVRFASEEKLKKNRGQNLVRRAALCGIRDYFLRRFGDSPEWCRQIRLTKERQGAINDRYGGLQN